RRDNRGCLGRSAGCDLRGLGLLAGAGVPVESAARHSAVDQLDELLVVLGRGGGVAGLGGRGEALRQRLDRRAVAPGLGPLLGGNAHSLLLLLDVRHSGEMPAPAGARRVAEPARRPPRRVTCPAVAAVQPELTHRRRLALSTAIFSLATGISRVLGLIREMVA